MMHIINICINLHFLCHLHSKHLGEGKPRSHKFINA